MIQFQIKKMDQTYPTLPRGTTQTQPIYNPFHKFPQNIFIFYNQEPNQYLLIHDLPLQQYNSNQLLRHQEKSCLPNNILRWNHSDCASHFFPRNSFQLDKVTFFWGYKYFNRNSFTEQYKTCNYGNQSREYFYDFRCRPWAQNGLNSTTQIYFSKPTVSVTGKLANTICSQITDPTTKNITSVLCQQYEAGLQANYTLADQGGLRSYVVFQGTRLPMSYPDTLKKVDNIENLEYGDNDYFDEKYDFYEKSKIFEAVYSSQQNNCSGQDILKKSQNFTVSKDHQDYFIIARNLSVCQAIQTPSGDEVYNEYIIGTIVTEISLLPEQIQTLAITGNISRIIQLSLSGSAIMLILIVAALNYYSIKLAHQLAEPIDDLIYQLRSIDDANIEIYFSELLQGEKAKETPYEMGLLIRSVYDFVGIVKTANEAFKQGNDSQAIIGYAVANQFYLENGNLLGAGMIQNNMGAIHVRNKRYFEASQCFIQSILCIESEWERYKMKYLKHGLTEQELQVDLEFQKLSTVVLNRCFNLSECLSQFLMTEMLQLEEMIYSKRMQPGVPSMLGGGEKANVGGDTLTFEKMIQAQMHMNILRRPSSAVINVDVDEDQSNNNNNLLINNNNNNNNNNNDDDGNMNRERKQTVLRMMDPKHQVRIVGQIQQLVQLNEILEPFRSRFVKNQNRMAFPVQQIEDMDLGDLHNLIEQLWRDTITTYEYCRFIMENPLQVQQQSQKRLYVQLKIIIGYLYLGQIEECNQLFEQADRLLQEAKNVDLDEDLQYPVSVLEQKYLLYKGLVYYKKGEFRLSSEQIGRSLFLEGQFSPRDRMEALIILKSILKQQELDYSMIDECLSRYQPIAKDMVFMVDIGKKMAKQRAIIKAMKTVSVLFKNVCGQNDRFSYGTFYQEYQELVPLMSKFENEPFIDQMLQYVPLPSNGNSQLMTALECVINKLIKASHTNVQKSLHSNEYHIKKDGNANIRYKRFIILLSDEFTQDANGNLQIHSSLINLINTNGIQLIVIQYDEDNDSIQWKVISYSYILVIQTPASIQFHHQLNIDHLLNYFDSLEEHIEAVGSNFYLEQTL